MSPFSDNAELRAKIDEAKHRLPLPQLLGRLGLEKHAKKSAHCLWHDDQHPSFSVFKGSSDGFWHYKCFVCDQQGGDEITFLVKHLNISRREAIKRYLQMAGFPTCRPSKSREYPKSPLSPEYPVSPVSEGQRVNAGGLESLATRNACTSDSDKPFEKRFKLARDVREVEERIGRKLSLIEPWSVLDGWHRLSQAFLDPAESFNDHWIAFLAELEKVRVPSGGGTFEKALNSVKHLCVSLVPVVPGFANEVLRRVAALHREMSRLCGGKVYFLSYRDASKVADGLTASKAHTITLALARAGVIEIVDKRQSGFKKHEGRRISVSLSSQRKNSEKRRAGV